MTNSILEINENEYLIKLNRRSFDLSFIRSLLKMVEVSEPVKAEKEVKEESFESFSFAPAPLVDRHIEPNQNNSAEPDYFSKLDEK
ncbi:hypothetical protein FPZ42_08680 [Mucilaginibacter achroorhodeus]|uniref:Uncharacterized protein n=1 Tax=Mucilaginibacter achroorhodeus TaxID=2599294 RepID=A0A563U6X4_9SPHI|nr:MULTISPECIES: hypothetical protein [Mucilaginibacter]QXV64947.1 hypothetical protein INP83_17960 [Mucilaginibacter sp. 21P]TWR27098.1 hypothetical protein FPZ42_08680 [Mucilaginibacter achroorhodeus]